MGGDFQHERVPALHRPSAGGARPPVDWAAVETVLLDMDGTVLDLRFDNHFWREHVPRRYAEARGIMLDEAKDELYPRFRAVEGTMDWYCVDYWTRILGLDIAGLKTEVEHLIRLHDRALELLDAVRRSGRRLLLVTNAHGKSLALKMRRTGIAGRFDALVCSHDFGRPKEDPAFWGWLRGREPYDPARTLLVDDSLAVLRSARTGGIAHLVAVRRPDSALPPRAVDGFPAVDGLGDLLPVEGGE